MATFGAVSLPLQSTAMKNAREFWTPGPLPRFCAVTVFVPVTRSKAIGMPPMLLAGGGGQSSEVGKLCAALLDGHPLEQGRINEAAGPLCSPDPRPDGATEKRRGGHLGPRVLVERRQLTLPAKARESRLEPLDEDPAELGGVVRRGRAGKRLPDQQANLAAHRIECEVVEAHDEEVVTGAGAAADPEDE